MLDQTTILVCLCGQAAQLQQALYQEEAATAAAQEQLAEAEEAYEKLHDSLCSLQRQHAALLEQGSALQDKHAHDQEQLKAVQAEHDTLLADLEASQHQVLTAHDCAQYSLCFLMCFCMLCESVFRAYVCSTWGFIVGHRVACPLKQCIGK